MRQKTRPPKLGVTRLLWKKRKYGKNNNMALKDSKHNYIWKLLVAPGP